MSGDGEKTSNPLAGGGADASRLRKEFGRSKVRKMHEFWGEHTVVVKLEALQEILASPAPSCRSQCLRRS